MHERTRRDDSVPRPSVRRREPDNGCSRNRCRRGARRGRPIGFGESAREGVARYRSREDARHSARCRSRRVRTPREPHPRSGSTSRGRSSGRVEAVGIHQHVIATVDPLPHVQHGLVLAAVTPLVEVPTSDGDRHADGADRQQLLEPLTNLRALGPRREVGLGQGILTIGPVSGFGGVSVLEPTVGIGNRLAMQDIDCVAGRSWRVARINHPG